MIFNDFLIIKRNIKLLLKFFFKSVKLVILITFR